jgi:predicted RNA-binding Zn-ribbon protein involved in translation (DUF1610 family)
MDALAQLTGDLWQLTPSVFVRARAGGEVKESKSVGLFRCPECGESKMEETEQEIQCRACSRVWAIQKGIYDFRKPVNP